MKIKTFISATLVAATCWLALTGCTGSNGVDGERFAALEAEVKALREDNAARDESLREELARLRTTLAAIEELLELQTGQPLTKSPEAPAEESGEEPGQGIGEDIDAKARGFIQKNLDRLMDLTTKLLDRMEQELEKEMPQNRPAPQPEGAQI